MAGCHKRVPKTRPRRTGQRDRAFARAVNMPSGEGPAHRELSTHGNPYRPRHYHQDQWRIYACCGRRRRCKWSHLIIPGATMTRRTSDNAQLCVQPCGWFYEPPKIYFFISRWLINEMHSTRRHNNVAQSVANYL